MNDLQIVVICQNKKKPDPIIQYNLLLYYNTI